MDLRYLYIGSDDTERDVAAWLRMPGAALRWRFQHFGADVAAIDLGGHPVLLIADHRPAGSVLPIYAVGDLDAAVAEMAGPGWTVELGPLGTPEGPASVLRNDSGVPIALLQVDRPDVMDGAYADDASHHAVKAPPLQR